MRITCPNNHVHGKFGTIIHVTQEVEIDEYGDFSEIITPCIEVTSSPYDQTYKCIECGANAVTKAEIATLYATVSSENTFPYINIYSKKEDAEKEVGEIIDDEKITGIIKGYSLRPLNGEYLYDDAPDFCFSVAEAIEKARELKIDLHNLTPVENY